MPGIFGDVLSGLAKANHEHQLNLMEMEHDEAKRKSALFAELAQSPNFEPQQQEWFLKAAIAHLTDPKEAKKYDIKNGMVQIPADIIKPKQPAAADLAAEQQPFQIPALTFGASQGGTRPTMNSEPQPGVTEGQMPIPPILPVQDIGTPATPGALQPRIPPQLHIPGTAAANPALIAPVAPPPELRSVAQPISQQTKSYRAIEQAKRLQEIETQAQIERDTAKAKETAALDAQKASEAQAKQAEAIASREKIAKEKNDADFARMVKMGLKPTIVPGVINRDGAAFRLEQIFDPATGSTAYREIEAGDSTKSIQQQELDAYLKANPGKTAADFAKEKQHSTDAQEYADLYAKNLRGEATTEEKQKLAGLQDRITLGTRTTAQVKNAVENPPADANKVQYIADQLALDASTAAINLLIGNNKTLHRQVTDELARRGTTIDQLTGQTKQLAQTAKDILPQFDKVISQISTPAMQAKLGPALGRWNEFETGKYGAGDPDFAKLRVVVDLLKTGALRAHFGARGGQQILERFDNLADAGKMDAATLSAALTGFRDFLKDTYVTPRYGETPGTPAAGGSKTPSSIDNEILKALQGLK